MLSQRTFQLYTLQHILQSTEVELGVSHKTLYSRSYPEAFSNNGLRLVPPLGNLYRVGCSPHNTWPGAQQALIRAQVQELYGNMASFHTATSTSLVKSCLLQIPFLC